MKQLFAIWAIFGMPLGTFFSRFICCWVVFGQFFVQSIFGPSFFTNWHFFLKTLGAFSFETPGHPSVERWWWIRQNNDDSISIPLPVFALIKFLSPDLSTTFLFIHSFIHSFWHKSCHTDKAECPLIGILCKYWCSHSTLGSRMFYWKTVDVLGQLLVKAAFSNTLPLSVTLSLETRGEINLK